MITSRLQYSTVQYSTSKYIFNLNPDVSSLGGIQLFSMLFCLKILQYLDSLTRWIEIRT